MTELKPKGELKLKTISKSGIAQAISKAESYRYLAEPEETESICRDILAADSGNQSALRMLGLAITDQLSGGRLDRWSEAESVFQILMDPYERLYCIGLLHERRAKAQLRAGQSLRTLVPLIENAMACFEQAEKIRPAGNDDSLLRWNRCARLLQSLPDAEPEKEMTAFEAMNSAPVA